jgi:hypothetical protein
MLVHRQQAIDLDVVEPGRIGVDAGVADQRVQPALANGGRERGDGTVVGQLDSLHHLDAERVELVRRCPARRDDLVSAFRVGRAQPEADPLVTAGDENAHRLRRERYPDPHVKSTHSLTAPGTRATLPEWRARSR